MQRNDTTVWIPIPGYEGRYEASRFGKIRSVDRVVGCAYGKTRTTLGKEILQRETEHGYFRIDLHATGKKTYLVHRLIALTFLEKENERYNVVNHKDGNPKNNYVDNLEWCTQAENVYHAKNELMRGVKPVIAVCKKSQKVIAKYHSAAEASRLTGYKFRGISKCANGVLNTYKGVIWRFA